jgi:hypothetical protein
LTAERPAAPSVPRIAVLADDLIWATRLVDGIRRAGGEPIPLRTSPAFEAALGDVDGALVDLTARAYDGIGALRAAAAAGVPSIAVGQHDDAALRRAAKDAGATRIHAYRGLFEHGDRELTRWLAALAATEEGDR